MTLDLKRIFANLGSKQTVEHTLDMSGTDYAGGFPLKSPVKVNGSIFNRAGVVTLCLNMEYVFTAPCDRCGTVTSKTHTVSLEKSLATSISGEASDTIITVPDMKLDVDELVFSEVYLNLPSKHLCCDDCRGICCKCGKNLNEGDCDCNFKEVDPRLSKLAELLNS